MLRRLRRLGRSTPRTVAPTNGVNSVTNGLARQKGVLAGGSLRARRLQRQQEAAALARKFQRTATTNGVEWTYDIVRDGVFLGSGDVGRQSEGVLKRAVSTATTGTLVIPDVLEGMPVRGVGCGAFSCCSNLTSVVIPPSVKNIGYRAFYECRGLRTVKIPSSVTNIEWEAFSGTPFYDNMPDGMVILGDGLLYKYKGECTASVDVPSHVTRICYGAFNRAYKMKEITLPPKLISIGDSAFYECGLTSLTLPRHVKSIGDFAFGHCHWLKSVTLSPELTRIEKWAFYGCQDLTSLCIPSSVTSIGDEAFSCCDHLTSIDVENGNREFAAHGGVVFTKDLTELVACPGGLTTVDIPSTMRSIRKGSLWWTAALQKFVVDAANENYCSKNGLLLTKDGSRLVAGLNGNVVVPPSVSTIDSHAFHGYCKLTSVAIPRTVRNIERDAFYACRGLRKVIVEKGDIERIKAMLQVGFAPPKVDKIKFEESDSFDENVILQKLKAEGSELICKKTREIEREERRRRIQEKFNRVRKAKAAEGEKN